MIVSAPARTESRSIEDSADSGLHLAIAPIVERPQARGKFLFVGEEKLWLRGVTYGTMGDDATGYPDEAVVHADFAAMNRAGLNAVRVYTVPPRWLLDEAARQGLRVMVGLPWEQHIAFLDNPGGARRILARLEQEIAPCLGHPAVLAYAVGNEIPASVVRWHGKRRIERFLKALTAMVRRRDPSALVTYVNFPTTEYLDLPFVDFLSFNVYLEDRAKLARYLARLQNLAGERPLVMAEIGLDSRRNGKTVQAETLRWQLETSFEAGCSGVFVFAWTDEWRRGGHAIEDWDFGLTSRSRRPKPALAAVSQTFAEAPFAEGRAWPRISVVVCSYNGSGTIEETLIHLAKVDYPDFEVIVIDDGSTDATPEIARRYDVRLVSTPNQGLSAARNLGMELSTGEIVAYTDDDAYPDPDWLKYLAAAFARSDHAAMGGPNIAPPQDGDTAECIANAPGGPLHVLIDDELAEHIPGCNMAYRRDRLMAVGGFDTQFRVAGDDVDVCWKLQAEGDTLGFCAAAMVWHHRRPSISRYLKQQRGYAKAEALLAAKWPEKYNAAGHMSWHGRLYGRGIIQTLMPVQRIYHGPQGTALFQSVYEPAPGVLGSLPLMPEWYFLVGSMVLLSLLGLAWAPLLWLAPFAAAAVAATLWQACQGAMRADFRGRTLSAGKIWKLRATVAWLHLLQPLARLQGRIQHGIGPWRRSDLTLTPSPAPREDAFWSETWEACETRLQGVEAELHEADRALTVGGDFDRWDVTIHGGLLGGMRAVAMIEEHGAGRQLFRLKAWPTTPRVAWLSVALLTLLTVLAAHDAAWFAAGPLAGAAGAFAALIYASCASASAAWSAALEAYATKAGLIRLGEDPPAAPPASAEAEVVPFVAVRP